MRVLRLKVPSFLIDALSWTSPALVALVCVGFVANLVGRILALLTRGSWSILWKTIELVLTPVTEPGQQGAVIVGGILFLLACFMVSKRLGIALGVGSFIVFGGLGLIYAAISCASGKAIGLGEVVYLVFIAGLSILYAFYSALKSFLLADPLTLTLIVALANVLGFVAAWIDSPRVDKDLDSRIPERRLLLYVALGGGAGVVTGAILSQNDKMRGGFMIALGAYACISYALLLSMFGALPG